MGRPRLFICGLIAFAVIAAVFFIWRAGLAQERKKQALEQAKQGDFWEAEPTLKAALAQDPHDVEVLRVLANGYVKSDRKNEAEECLTQWVEAAPRDPEPLLLRLKLYRELGRLANALLDVDRLLEIDPGNTAWRRKRVDVLYASGRFVEAETECQVCLQSNPRDLGLRRSLAEIKRARGEFAEAGAILDAILKDAPRDTGAMMSRAQLHLSQNEPDKSIPLFRKVLESDPNRQRVGRYNLALALNRVGQTEEAGRLMEEVRRMQEAGLLLTEAEGQPKNIPLQIRAARAQFENNDLYKTIHILRNVLSVDASCAPAHALMADVLDKQGQFDLAAQHRRQAKDQP